MLFDIDGCRLRDRDSFSILTLPGKARVEAISVVLDAIEGLSWIPPPDIPGLLGQRIVVLLEEAVLGVDSAEDHE